MIRLYYNFSRLPHIIKMAFLSMLLLAISIFLLIAIETSGKSQRAVYHPQIGTGIHG